MARDGTSSRRKAATSSGTKSVRRGNGGSPGGATTNRRTNSTRRRGGSSSSASKRGSATSKNVGTKAKDLASKAKNLKTPMIAGGAAIGGLAGGWALAAKRDKTRKVLGVRVPRRGSAGSTAKNLGTLAKQVAVASERVGELTSEVRRVREQTAKPNRRSPVEVVLEGLTSRRVPG